MISALLFYDKAISRDSRQLDDTKTLSNRNFLMKIASQWFVTLLYRTVCGEKILAASPLTTYHP
ncbi:hypothetical protein WS87_13720 [Burkholderia sp. MSMB0856]|nr:hypothetical protein WS87_13720 [Burkholderia sp. MSMB0856]